MPGVWTGIQVNFTIFQGTIVADPVESNGHVFLTLETMATVREANGQYTEVSQMVPLMVEPGGPVKVALNHIKTGRKLMAWGHYRSWEANGILNHAFSVHKFDLGDKPFEK
jgi:hypothetical protein